MPEEDMNLSINGQSQVPPGFRFHPTEEELLHYYLRKKVAFEKIDLDVIREVDLNKLEPWDIQEKCKIGSTPQNDWYFFSHKDKKYPTGTRTNRATAAGFWKATGRDKIIYSGFRRIGLRKTLVFYKGRAPHGQKSDWIMHEYRLEDTTIETTTSSNPIGDGATEEGWVVCRVFRKKNYQKTLESPKGNCSSASLMDSKTQILSPGNDGVLDQILLYMGRTCKMENDSLSNNIRLLSAANSAAAAGGIESLHERFIHLPRLDSPTVLNSVPINSPSFDQDQHQNNFKSYQSYDDMLAESEPSSTSNHQQQENGFENMNKGVNDWVTLDRLVASQLNGQVDTPKQLSSCFSTDPNASFGLSADDDMQLSHLHSHRSSNQTATATAIAAASHQQHHHHQVYNNEADLWSFAKSSSSSDPLSHLSV